MTFLTFLLAINMMAQHTIQGTVSLENGEPCIGASVVMKGTNRGVVIDVDGKYHLEISDTSPILVFSFVGYVTQEIAATGLDSLNIVLKDDLFIPFPNININSACIKRSKRLCGNYVTPINDDDIRVKEYRVIKGKVTDAEGDPLVEAAIAVKGTTLGVITDIDGSYTLTVPADAQTLKYSFVGTQTVEKEIGTLSTIDVSLKGLVLDELVITAKGYFRDRSHGCCSCKRIGFHAQYSLLKELATLNIKVAGNPFTEQFALDIDSENEETSAISLRNIEGKTVKTMVQRLQKGYNHLEISDLSNLVAGLYTVSVDVLDEKYEPKTVIESVDLEMMPSLFREFEELYGHNYQGTKSPVLTLNKQQYERLVKSDAFIQRVYDLQRAFRENYPDASWRGLSYIGKEGSDPEEILFYAPYKSDIQNLIREYKELNRSNPFISDDDPFEQIDFDKNFSLEKMTNNYWIYLVKKEVSTKKKHYAQVVVKM